MNDSITRKTEVCGRAKQAYRRVADEHRGGRQHHCPRSRSTASSSWWEANRVVAIRTEKKRKPRSEDRKAAEDEERWYDALHGEDDQWDGSHYSSQGRPSWFHHEEEAWAVDTPRIHKSCYQTLLKASTSYRTQLLGPMKRMW